MALGRVVFRIFLAPALHLNLVLSAPDSGVVRGSSLLFLVLLKHERLLATLELLLQAEPSSVERAEARIPQKGFRCLKQLRFEPGLRPGFRELKTRGSLI